MADFVVVATVLTHNGDKRPSNEDAVVVGSCTFTSVSCSQPHTVVVPVRPGEPVIVAVADGLGGHQAGEVAAAHVVHRLARAGGSALKAPEDVADILQVLSAELDADGQRHPEQRGMGTTVVGLLVSPQQVVWFNIGDSRAYTLSGGYLGQMSVDDTPAAVFAEAGESPAPTSIITQSIGSSPPPSAHTGVESVSADGAYLLCSDGLSDLVKVAEIERVLAAHADDDPTAVKALWAAAMNAGGRDNITIVLVRALPHGRARAPDPATPPADPAIPPADAPPAEADDGSTAESAADGQ
jgi:serine/threonine protein phosphatase PrpC